MTEGEFKQTLKQRDETIIKQADEIHALRAELAAIKPDWNDAPEWATTWYIECGWAGDKPCIEEPYMCDTERRPTEES